MTVGKATAALAIGIVAVLGACGGASLPTPTPGIGPTATSTITPTNPGSSASHVTSRPRGTLTRASIDLTSGATDVEVTAAPIDALVRASTPLRSGQQPVLTSAGPARQRIDLGLRTVSGEAGGSSVVRIVLSSSVRWTIGLDGGATVERVDMRHGAVSLVDLGAGVSRATVLLPERKGTQTVRESGGASSLSVVAPVAARARVSVGGGSSHVVVDGVVHTGVSGGTVFVQPGYSTSAARVFVDLRGGVSGVVVRRS